MTAKDLKTALLQEAVQGKLVPQIASEGNARDLLEEIRKEKLSHGFANSYGICDGKDKKTKKSDLRSKSQISVTTEITEDEIPFEIPENWCWCRLGEVFETTSGTTPQSKNPIYYNNGTIGWVRTTDLNNGILSFAEIKITEKAKSDCNLKIIPKNSVCIALYGGAGTIGKNAILNFETTINQSVCAILPTKFADMRYLQYFLQWQRPYWMDYASGSRKDPNINQIIVKNCPFPLPPLSEQKRIVAAIEKFMPLIEEYGKKESALKAINEQIGALTKKAILQEAVQGKLVPQIASEGNARDLLEEIRKEKLSHGFANSYGICSEKGKKSKSSDLRSKSQIRVTKKELPEITEEEIPFDIPESWCWCRLGELCTKLVDGDHNPPAGLQEKTEYLMLSSRNINDDKLVDLDLVRYLSKEVFEKENERTKAEKGDIFFTSVGTLGRSCIFDGSINVSFQRSVSIIKTEIFNYYLKYCLDSGYVQNFVVKNATGTAQKGFYLNQLAELIIPLPPLAEQKRIVAAIEKMLPLCEKLGE